MALVACALLTPQEVTLSNERLLEAACRFSSLVELDSTTAQGMYVEDASPCLVLEAGASISLFKGEKQFCYRFKEHFLEAGYVVRLCLAPTVGSAWALCHYGDANQGHSGKAAKVTQSTLVQSLFPLSIRALRLPLDTIIELEDVELFTIGDLLPLDRRSLTARFGALLGKRIDQALGLREEQIQATHVQGPLRLNYFFQSPVTDQEPVFLVVRKLLDVLLDRLAERGTKPGSLIVEIAATGVPIFKKGISLSAASTNKQHLWKLLHARLERLATGFGVESVSLTAVAEEKLTPRFFTPLPSEEEEPTRNSKNELLDTLEERLGKERVLTMSCHESHIPEKSYGYQPKRVATEGAMKLPESDRPSVLFSQPQKITAMSVLPDSPPFWFKWKGETFRVAGAVGPERITGEWWAEEEVQVRDYFKVILHSGAWLWIFRSNPDQWYIHGLWA